MARKKRRKRSTGQNRQRISSRNSIALSKLTNRYLIDLLHKYRKARLVDDKQTLGITRNNRLHEPRKSPPRPGRDQVRHKNPKVERPVRDQPAPDNARRQQRETHIRAENIRRVCARRMVRRDSLFALRIAGRGKGGPKKRKMTENSKIHCK